MVLKVVKFYKILFLILVFVLLSKEVYAINLGSVIKDRDAELVAGNSVKLEMLFWNSEEKSYNVKLSTYSPKNLIVIVDPEEFSLNKVVGEEYINLAYSEDPVKAKVVNLFVKADENSKPGKYYIILNALVENGENKNSNVEINPRRIFTFEIDLINYNFFEDGSDVEASEDFFYSNKNVVSKPDNKMELNNSSLFILSLIFLTLIIIYNRLKD